MAWVSRFVARNTALEAENAFLLGLLHDIGLSVAVIGAAQYLREQRRPVELTALTWMAVEAVHERFAADVLRSWGLPASLVLVAGNHHALQLDGHPHPQIAVLMVAEQIAVNAGWGVVPMVEQGDGLVVSTRECSQVEETDKALAVLSLDRGHFELISRDTARVLETLAAQFEAGRKAGS